MSLKVFCWKEDEKLPDGNPAPYSMALVCVGSWTHIGHLTCLSPRAASKQELDSYIDKLHAELEIGRKKGHRWFDKQ